MSTKKTVAASQTIDFLTALRAVQDHLDAQAAITGRHERLNLVGHPPSCNAKGGDMRVLDGLEIVGGDDIPLEVLSVLEQALGARARRGGGGH
jgi:hypothetical protein